MTGKTYFPKTQYGNPFISILRAAGRHIHANAVAPVCAQRLARCHLSGNLLAVVGVNGRTLGVSGSGLSAAVNPRPVGYLFHLSLIY